MLQASNTLHKMTDQDLIHNPTSREKLSDVQKGIEEQAVGNISKLDQQEKKLQELRVFLSDFHRVKEGYEKLEQERKKHKLEGEMKSRKSMFMKEVAENQRLQNVWNENLLREAFKH